jgi:hypothetical protein
MPSPKCAVIIWLYDFKENLVKKFVGQEVAEKFFKHVLMVGKKARDRFCYLIFTIERIQRSCINYFKDHVLITYIEWIIYGSRKIYKINDGVVANLL